MVIFYNYNRFVFCIFAALNLKLRIMDRFEVNASWIVFHCYNGGEWEDTKGFIDINEPKDGCVQSVFDDDYDDSF